MDKFHNQAQTFQNEKPEMSFDEFEHKMINKFEDEGIAGELSPVDILILYATYFRVKGGE